MAPSLYPSRIRNIVSVTVAEQPSCKVVGEILDVPEPRIGACLSGINSGILNSIRLRNVLSSLICALERCDSTDPCEVEGFRDKTQKPVATCNLELRISSLRSFAVGVAAAASFVCVLGATKDLVLGVVVVSLSPRAQKTDFESIYCQAGEGFGMQRGWACGGRKVLSLFPEQLVVASLEELPYAKQ